MPFKSCLDSIVREKEKIFLNKAARHKDKSQLRAHIYAYINHKGWGLSAKLGKHSAICSKLGTALQAYALNPCTKFAANPTSRKVNT